MNMISGPRKFRPLPETHPLVTDQIKCQACGKVFLAGDVTTLIALGPGDDPDTQQKAYEGKAYNAIALPVHYSCAYGKSPFEDDTV